MRTLKLSKLLVVLNSYAEFPLGEKSKFETEV